MNQSLLIRLFKSIDGDEQSPLFKIASSIIESEVKKGHHKLAGKLRNILDDKKENFRPTLKRAKSTKEFKIPVDLRYRIPLAKHISNEFLRHEMVLSKEIEYKIERIEKEYAARDRLAKSGLRHIRKVLLYGPSGCGKSMAAERIAWDLGLPFYKVRFDSIISSFMGESASNLNNLFTSIQDYPCVLLLDEFDIIGKKRNSKNQDVGEIHRIVNVVLGLLEDYNGRGILVATTNLEGSLDNALFRRFDEIIHFTKPSTKQILKLLKLSLASMKLEADVALEKFAKELKDFSYAIIVKVAKDAAKKAVITSNSKISNKLLLESLKENTVFNS